MKEEYINEIEKLIGVRNAVAIVVSLVVLLITIKRMERWSEGRGNEMKLTLDNKKYYLEKRRQKEILYY